MNSDIMKRIFYVTAIIVLACTVASSFIAGLTVYEEEKARETANSFVYKEEGYVLTALEDRIVAYRRGEDEPFIYTETAVSSLPLDVQNKLKRGITFKSRKELNAVLYEYCS